MTKADIVQRIAQNSGLDRTNVVAVVDRFLETVSAALAAGEHIEIRGFGTFRTVIRAPRTGRNPRTGSEVRIGERRAPVFKTSKELKARVEAPKRAGDNGYAMWPEEEAA